MKPSSDPLARHVSRPLPPERLEGLWAGVQQRRRRRRVLRRARGGAAAAMVVLLGALAFVRGRPPLLATGATLEARGASEVRRLADGSRLRLLPGGRLRAEQATASAVRLQLARGTIELEVRRVPARGFVVQAGGYEARVVGTRFRVDLSDGFPPEVQVLVDEGQVEIWRPEGAGALALAVPGTPWSALAEDGRPPRWAIAAEPEPAAAPALPPRLLETATRAQRAAGEEPRQQSGFVERRGRQLLLDGEPYRFLGYTAFTLTGGCALRTYIPSDEDLDAFFGSLRPRSVVRTMAYESLGLEALERVVSAARRHDQKLMLVLTDADAYCGESAKTPAWYAGGYQESYLPWVRTVATRLRDERAVAIWELVKGPTRVEPAVLRAFFDEVGGELHRVAPRHLVASGTHGPGSYGGEAGYRLVHDSPGIDVATFHDYNMRWGAAVSVPEALAALEPIDRPLVIAAAAFAASRGGGGQYLGKPCLSFETRVEAFRAKLDESFALGVAGVAIWSWFPRGNQESCRLETYPGDPLVELVRDYPLP